MKEVNIYVRGNTLRVADQVKGQYIALMEYKGYKKQVNIAL